jgi:hypothetical protein
MAVHEKTFLPALVVFAQSLRLSVAHETRYDDLHTVAWSEPANVSAHLYLCLLPNGLTAGINRFKHIGDRAEYIGTEELGVYTSDSELPMFEERLKNLALRIKRWY